MACLVAAQRWLRSSVQDTAALQCDGRIMYFTYAKRLILVPSKVVSAKISEEILRTIKSSPSHVRKQTAVWCGVWVYIDAITGYRSLGVLLTVQFTS